jgi:hypothetical protein
MTAIDDPIPMMAKFVPSTGEGVGLSKSEEESIASYVKTCRCVVMVLHFNINIRALRFAA